MKKKVVSLFMACVFLFACALPAFAGSKFDESVLSKGDDISCTESSGGSTKFYKVKSTYLTRHDSKNNIGNAKARVVLVPEVLTYNSTSKSDFFLYFWIDRQSDTSVAVKEIAFALKESNGDRAYYYFSNPSDNVRADKFEESDVKWVGDSFIVKLNENSFTMLDDLAENSNGTFSVYVKTENSDDFIYCADFSQEEVDSLTHLYNLYKKAGGLSEDNLEAIKDEGTEYSVSYKYSKN